MKLGGFVIHGNAGDTLRACLESLGAVSDEVVAVDSGSTDGSAAIDAQFGIRRIELPWQGYGAARAAAARALASCDYLFFLDSDEHLVTGSDEQIRRWKASSPDAPAYQVKRHDWVDLDGHRFRFRTSARRRLLRRDAARWTPSMIVHEAVAPVRTVLLPRVAVDHRFATALDERAARNDRYALLWAVQAFDESRPSKPAALQRLAHFGKEALLSGSLFRGGADALRLSWRVSRYHALKYQFLRRLRRGEMPDLVELYRRGDFRALFGRADETLGLGRR